MDDAYKPDPEKGGIHVEARKKEVLQHLKSAIDVAYYHIDQQLDVDIAELKKRAGETKSKMVSQLRKAENMPALTVVRKYWQKDANDIVHVLTDTIMRNNEQ